MRRLCMTVMWLIVLAALLGISACAAEVRQITYVPEPDDETLNPINQGPVAPGPYGWTSVKLKSESGVKPKGDFSYYFSACKGTSGPSPAGSFWFQAGEVSDGKECAQVWLGTDYYGKMVEEDDGDGFILQRGPKLSKITKLSYYAILEKKGQYSRKLLSGSQKDENFHIKFAEDIYVIGWNSSAKTYERLAEWDSNAGNWEAGATLIDNPHYDSVFYNKYKDEFTYSSYASQPPAMVLYIADKEGNNRVLIYRPWSSGTGSQKGFGSNAGGQCNRWKKYDCLFDGCWYDPWGHANPADGTKFWLWSELVADGKYKDWHICTPNLPTMGLVYDADAANNAAPTGCSINFTIGALNKDWWPEAYNACGAIDKFELAFNDTGVVVDDEYNFEQETTFEPVVRLLNNKALYENLYLPSPRTRGSVNWGGGSVSLAYMNALQRGGNFNTSYIPGDTFVTSTGRTATKQRPNQYVLYGKVLSDPLPTQNVMYVDDGSGKNVLVYSADGFPEGYLGGEYVRCQGSAFVCGPYDWNYNNFHIIELEGDSWKDPNGTWTDIMNKPHEPEFHTYRWNIQTLRGGF